MKIDKEAVRIVIPEGLDFSSLALSRDPADGYISFDWAPIEAICAASGIDVSLFRDQPEDNVAPLVNAWYAEHISRGGAPDAVQEAIIAEVIAEDANTIAANPGVGNIQ